MRPLQHEKPKEQIIYKESRKAGERGFFEFFLPSWLPHNLLFCAVLVILSVPVSAEQKGLTFQEKPGDYGEFYDHSYAVCVGINDYDYWPDLSYAEADARAMAELFRAQGIESRLILGKQATRKAILTALGDDLKDKAGPDDRVIIYFSGHGHTESLASGRQAGYIVPVDCPQSEYLAGAVSMTQLREIHDRLSAKHILYLMDSCYSGQGFLKSGNVDPGAADYVEVVTRRRAVQMMTAGEAGQQAQEGDGHGLFTEYLLRGLKGEADIQPVDGVVTVGELGLFVEAPVFQRSNGRQRPRYGRLDGEGEVVFVTAPEKRLAFTSEIRALAAPQGKSKGSSDIFAALRAMPEVRAALARRKARRPEIDRLFSNALIGLLRDGLLAALPSDTQQSTAALVAEENIDRMIFIQGMAEAQLHQLGGDTPDTAQLELTQQSAQSLFAETQMSALKPGWHFQTQDGTWERKADYRE